MIYVVCIQQLMLFSDLSLSDEALMYVLNAQLNYLFQKSGAPRPPSRAAWGRGLYCTEIDYLN